MYCIMSCVYVCMNPYIYIYMYAYTLTHTCVYTYTYIHIEGTYTHAYTQAGRQAGSQAGRQAGRHKGMQTRSRQPHAQTNTPTHTHKYVYMMQGCHTPPPPPPHGTPLACQVGSCLVWPCCFPRLVLFGLVPSPPVEWGLRSFWLAPPRLWGAVCSTEVWYGCCRLLVVMSSLHALSPPGGACGRFGWPHPACVGQCVLQRYGMVAAAC